MAYRPPIPSWIVPTVTGAGMMLRSFLFMTVVVDKLI